MSNDIKKITTGFIKQHKLITINYSVLKKAAVNMGYTIIEYNNIVNEKDVHTVIENLKLGDMILSSRGFTYVSKDYRLIFINEDLNDEEKLIVLSHEIGHIVCGHFVSAHIIGKDVKEEYEANEFSHHLLNKSVSKSIIVHQKSFIIAVIMLCLFAVILAAYFINHNKNTYHGDFYITSTGQCYHKKDCIFIKNKTNSMKLTTEKFESGNYSPCDMCLPDKN